MTQDHRVLSTRQTALALGGAGAACAAAASAYQVKWKRGGKYVATHTFWDLIDRPVREALSDAGRTQILRDGQTYLRQGERGDRVCVVMEGTLKICMISDYGEETVLDLHGPGEIVGEMEAMHGDPRVASAVSKGMTKVLTFSGAKLQEIMRAEPGVADVLLRVVSDRLRNAAEMRGARGSARHRVTALVYHVAQRYGRDTQTTGEVAINPPLNREEFANWAGTSRGSAGRAMSWLQGKGVIRRDGQEIFVNWRELRRALRDLGQDHEDD